MARPEVTGKAAGRRYLTNPKIAERYGVCDRTVVRWQCNPRLKFPQPEEINGRKYTNEEKLDNYDDRRAAALLANDEESAA